MDDDEVVELGVACWPKVQAVACFGRQTTEEVELRVWRHDEEEHQWDLRRVMVHCLCRRPLLLGKFLKREGEPYRQLLVRLFGDDGILPPLAEVTRLGLPATAYHHDQFSIRSCSLLGFLVCLASPKHARHQQTAGRAHKLLLGILRQFVGNDSIDDIAAKFISDAARAACDDNHDDDGHCVHLSAMLRHLEVINQDDSWSFALTMLLDLENAASSCDGIAIWLGECLLATADAIDSSISAADIQEDTLKTEPVRSGKRKLGIIESDFKRATLAKVAAGDAASAQAYLAHRDDACKDGAKHWVEQMLRLEIAKGWLTWSSGGPVFVCPDGFECGGEENMCTQFWHCNSLTGGWLPIQDLSDRFVVLKCLQVSESVRKSKQNPLRTVLLS